ncbi:MULTISPECIES: hypothetical protein [Rhodonellum]|uniref:Uncharacterized protein n=1 Tax=Rhodonellum ikkaensis TaxID=336829 RepID=A0A1H3SRD6_9BACT|nr:MULTISPECIES: hypothetical protein [Rhodonellum]SDZ40125.1 hypothetical protein SAMN05444412_1133 [Rhodonellum ikkaensis]
MSQFEKTYIGKGSKVNGLDIIRVSIARETLEGILKSQMVDFEGNEYFVRSGRPQRSRHLRKDPHGLHQQKSPCPKKENGQEIRR